jgi:AcrR family transcriptional regulator
MTRSQRKAAATADAITAAAEALVAEGGLSAVTLEAVAERADVAVQTIYNRIGGRPALLKAVIQRAYDSSRAHMDPAYAAPGSALERLLGVAQAYVTWATAQPHQFRLLVSPPTDATGLDYVGDLVARQTAQLSALFADGIAAGEINAGLDPQQTATSVWAMFDGLLSLTFRTNGAGATLDQIDDLLATATLVIGDGLRPRP